MSVVWRTSREAGLAERVRELRRARQVGGALRQVAVGLGVVRDDAPEQRHRAAEPHRVAGAEQRGWSGTVASSAAKRPPGRSDARALAEHGVEVDEVAQREPARHAVDAAVAQRERARRRRARAARVGVRGREHPGREVDADRRVARTRRGRGRGRRCRTRGRAPSRPARQPSASTVRRRQPLVEAERDDRGSCGRSAARGGRTSPRPRRACRRPAASEPSCPSADALTSPLGSQPGSLRAAASSRRSPTASRCSCATSSSTRRKWCATSVVTVGSSVRNASTSRSAFSSSSRSAGLDRTADVLVEHLDRVAGDRARRVVVAARQREEVGEREAGFEQAQAGAQHVGVGRGVARTRRRAAGRRAALRATTASSSGAGTPTRVGELVEGEELGVAGLRAGDRGGERHVGGVELTGERAGGSPRARSPGAGGP